VAAVLIHLQSPSVEFATSSALSSHVSLVQEALVANAMWILEGCKVNEKDRSL